MKRHPRKPRKRHAGKRVTPKLPIEKFTDDEREFDYESLLSPVPSPMRRPRSSPIERN